LDIIANTEIEKIESDEDTKYEDVEHSDKDEQVLTTLCYDKDKMKAKIIFMNMIKGEIFQMKIGDEDSDDEELYEDEVAFLDSGCSKTSLRSRRHFSKLKKLKEKQSTLQTERLKLITKDHLDHLRRFILSPH